MRVTHQQTAQGKEREQGVDVCGVEGYIVKVRTAQAMERKRARGSLAATTTRDPR